MLGDDREDEGSADEDAAIDVQDLAIDEIRELLVEAGAEITPAQTEQLAALVAQAGGIDEALVLLAQLSEQREAA